MLELCTGLDTATRFVAVLTGYAESDYDAAAKNPVDDTWGVYQQNPRYWPSARLGTAAQCRAFLADYAANRIHHNGDPVHDAWITQRWSILGSSWPSIGPMYVAERQRGGSQTWNYARRLVDIDKMIRTRRVPATIGG